MQKSKKINSHNYCRISHRTQNIGHHRFEAPCTSLFSSVELWTLDVSRNLSGLEEDWTLYVCHCNVQTEREEICGGSPSLKGSYEFVLDIILRMLEWSSLKNSF